MSFRLFALLALGAEVVFSIGTQSISVSIPNSPPEDASPPVDPSFPALAFEEASFVNYSTSLDGSPNAFSQGLINSIFSRTGGKPLLRVGGTSGDHATFQQDLGPPTDPVVTLHQAPAFHNLTIGPSLFPHLQNLDANYVINVPLANKNLTDCIATAVVAWNASKDLISALEIGNEPSLYDPEPDVSDYVALHQQFEQAVLDAIPDLPTGPFFQGPDTDSGHPNDFPPADLFAHGFNANGRIKTYSQHYYQQSINSTFTFANDLLNHDVIKNKLDVFKPWISFLRSNGSAPIPFALTEVGNLLGGSDHGPDYTSLNNLGTALWALDLQLYAMSIGVSRVHLQQIMAAPRYQLWLPQESEGVPAHVKPQFYAQPFVADFIGRNQTRVANLETQGDVVAYAAYNSEELTRVALVNMEYWIKNGTAGNATAGGLGDWRPSETVTLTGLGNGTIACVRRLTAPDGTMANNTLSYGGLQWQYPEGKDVRVSNMTETVPVRNGSANVSVGASEAVMVVLK